MSVKGLLVDFAVDAVLGVYGVVGALVGVGMVATGEAALAGVIFLATGGLSVLYTRHRAQKMAVAG